MTVMPVTYWQSKETLEGKVPLVLRLDGFLPDGTAVLWAGWQGEQPVHLLTSDELLDNFTQIRGPVSNIWNHGT